MLSFVTGAAGFVLLLLVAPLLMRLMPATAAVVPQMGALLLAFAVSSLVGMMAVDNFSLWSSIATLGLLVTLYIYAFGVVYKSVSLTMLLELSRHSGDDLQSEIIERTAASILDERLDLLLASNWIGCTDGRYFITSSGRSWAKGTLALRSLFGIQYAGFYDH